MKNIRKIIREEISKIITPSPEVINIDFDEGSIFGVIHYDRQHINNWIEKEHVIPNLDTIPDDELFPIGILKNINVNEENRGNRYGVDLLEKFMIECSHCSYIILIADTGEEQTKGFNLIDWYKREGFEIWGEAGGMPVMIQKNEEMNEISLSVGHSMGPKPGIERRFPTNDEGGYSLNLSVSDGPHQFPKEKYY